MACANLSFPSLAWERKSEKLRFSWTKFVEVRIFFIFVRWTAKQSFADVRSQAELGNESSYVQK